MRKTNSAKLLASALLSDGKIWDESAETCDEIAVKIKKSACQARKLIKKKVDGGELEVVWRRIGGRPVPAYRVKQK